MSLSEKYGVLGLITDPSPAQLKAGALSEAKEVTFRRAGMVEPRPGFALSDDDSPFTDVYKLIPFDDGMLAIGAAAEAVDTHWLGNATEVEDESSAGLQWSSPLHMRGAVARKNLYLTTSDAVRKLTSSSDVVAERTGMVPPVMFASAGSAGTLLSTNTRAAYRATFVRTDANGVEVESAPSARAIAENDSGGATSVDVTVYLYDDIVAGDRVRLYRSRVVADTLTAPDAMALVKEHEITSTNVSNENLTIVDDLADANVGASLYTNPTREGIERGNVRPPRARDIALFQGSLFAADIAYPPRLKVAYTQGGNALAGSATGIGQRQYTGTRTNASNQITGLSSVVGLKVGQILSLSATWSAGPVRITAIAGSDLTMSATWTGATDGAPVNLSFRDTIRISDGSEDQYYGINDISVILRDVTIGGPSFDGTAESSKVRVYPVNDSIHTVNGAFQNLVRRELVIESLLPSHAGFEVWATHGSEYEPPLPEPTVADGEPSVATAAQNIVSWSKTDQPEHFLLSALWYVGVETSPILRIIPTRDALLILKGKGDGVYKLTGFGERSGWRVDPVDTDTYLLHPELALETDGRVYAWTNKGLVQITDAGVSPPLNAPIANLTGGIEQMLDLLTAESFAASAANSKDGELIFGLPPENPNDDDPIETFYVYHTATGRWSTWYDGADTHRTIAVVQSTGQLMLGGDYADVRLERSDPAGSTIVHADLSHSCTISTVVGTTVTIAGGSGWTPAVGDMLVQGANTTHVSAITSATVFTVMSATGLGAGAATGYVAFTSSLTWQPNTGGSSSAWKHYLEHVTHWDDSFGLARWSIVFTSGEALTTATHDYTRTLNRSTHPRADTRALPPRTVAHARHLITGVTVKCADARWRLTGIALGAEGASMRATR